MKFKRSHSHQKSITQYSFWNETLCRILTCHRASLRLASLRDVDIELPETTGVASRISRPSHPDVKQWISCLLSLSRSCDNSNSAVRQPPHDSGPSLELKKQLHRSSAPLKKKNRTWQRKFFKKKWNVDKSGTKAAKFPELLNRPAATEPLVPVSCQQSFHFGKKKHWKHRVRSRPPNPRNAGQRPWRLVAPKHSLHHESNLTSLPTRPKILLVCSKLISPL